MSASNGASADLSEAFRLLFANPARSEAICRAALENADDASARLLLAGALRLQGDAAGALDLTAPIAREHPNWPGAQYEHALALAAMGEHAQALGLLRKLEGVPLPGLWRVIGDQHWALGDRATAEQAYLRHVETQTHEPALLEALAALQRNDLAFAEKALREQLARYPNDPLALRHLAEVCSSTDRYEEAAHLLRSVLERAPSFALARYGLAMVLLHDHRLPQALEHLDALLAREPKRLEYLTLKAEALSRLGDFEAAAACLQEVVAIHPNAGGSWSAYGHALRALGRRDECEGAYKRAIALKSQVGEAWWGLANLKTHRFALEDVAAMRVEAARAPESEDKISLLFALGKALEDQADYAASFAAYSQANAARRARWPHNATERAEAMDRARAVFTPDFFAARRGLGRQDGDPIFVIGMPRSGSTLVEQILSSHSRVEGTMELNELLAIAWRLGRGGRFPEVLRDSSPEALAELGGEYLDRTRVYRRTGAPLFIDKMPNNFTQIGLIQVILPNARIIDVRRHPLACGVSNFKQHWATGQTFAYDLADIGAFYRDYVELMAHFDAALPGRVHRIIYEELVAEPEAETRRLLEACGLPFEEACLRFYENRRAVRTPSSEQVRQPIYSAGVDAWRVFEPWLGPLKEALGPVLSHYPAAPPL